MLINTRTYSSDRVQADAVRYTGVSNTLTIKDWFEMKRTYPKPTSTFLGVGRSSFKFTKTVVVNAVTGATADLIFSGSWSVPVGATTTVVDAMGADVAAWVNTTDGKALANGLDINA